ncbi:MAG: cytochrome c [Gemmatimonadetes bacterium]|nr:MAG: cytochrome c [Gemmatimonadota bacterium]
MRLIPGLVVVLIGVSLIGCYRGAPSKKSPIKLQHNMFQTQRYNPQSESQFFVDKATMRPPVAGTVAQGFLAEDSKLYRGRDARDSLVVISPIPPTEQSLARGQEQYNIYCAPCHSRVGDGRGIVVLRTMDAGYVPPPSFHQDRLRRGGLNGQDGHIFDVITNGIRNMPMYRHQIRVEDRWHIVNYVRALQFSQNATSAEVPSEVLDQLSQ